MKQQDSKAEDKDKKYPISTHNRSNNFFEKEKKNSQQI